MRELTKKLLVCLLVSTVLMGQFGLSSNKAQAATKKVTKITLNHKSYSVTKGKKVTLAAYANSSKTKLKKVTWKSSDKKIATVSSKGVVTGKKYGKATITASVKGVKKKATCKITVSKSIAVKSVTLSLEKVSLTTGQVYELKQTVNPGNASNKKVTWTSSNPAVATVADGKVTALSSGTTAINVTTTNGKKTATCNVTVSTPTSGLTVTPASKQLLVNEQFQLASTLVPANADNKTVTWSSSNPSLISVSEAGIVTALRPGTANITCISGTLQATCAVTVPTGYDVLDIQNVTVGDSALCYYNINSYNNYSGYITIEGDKAMTNNLAFKVADGATYEIINQYQNEKTVVVTYKNLQKVYDFNYSKYSNTGLISSASDSGNMITYFNIEDKTDGDTLVIRGLNPTLSNSFTVGCPAGSSAVISTDPLGKYARIITITKGTEISHINVKYERNYSKVAIQGIKDSNQLFIDFDYGMGSVDSNKVLQPGYLELVGTSTTYNSNYAVEVGNGATYTVTANPDAQYEGLVTVAYGEMQMQYNLNYICDTRAINVLSVTDGANVITYNIFNNYYGSGKIEVYGLNTSLSSEFAVTPPSGYTCSYAVDPYDDYNNTIIVTISNGILSRKFYVTYTAYALR